MLDFLRKVLDRETAPLAGARLARTPRVEPAERLRRRSNGLRHFFDSIPKARALEVLDLGGINEANVNFLSERGGRVHAVDLLERFDEHRSNRATDALELSAARDFVDDYLNFARNQFDAVLVWDALEFLDSNTLHLSVPRLHDILRPGGALLTFFQTHGRGETVQVYRYLIEDGENLTLQPRQVRSLPNTYNNRSLERLFSNFESVKFFLTRDSLREVIVSR